MTSSSESALPRVTFERRHRHSSSGSSLATPQARVAAIDNRKIARLAKFAGAPDSPAAGLRLHARLGDKVEQGEPLLTLHSETETELDYALDYAGAIGEVIRIEAAP